MDEDQAEKPMTLKERNKLLMLAEGQEQSAAIFAAGGTIPNPKLAAPQHAARLRARAQGYRERAAAFRSTIEGEDTVG